MDLKIISPYRIVARASLAPGELFSVHKSGQYSSETIITQLLLSREKSQIETLVLVSDRSGFKPGEVWTDTEIEFNRKMPVASYGTDWQIVTGDIRLAENADSRDIGALLSNEHSHFIVTRFSDLPRIYNLSKGQWDEHPEGTLFTYNSWKILKNFGDGAMENAVTIFERVRPEAA